MPRLAATAWKYRSFIWKHRRGLWKMYEHRTAILTAAGVIVGYVAADMAGRAVDKRL